MKYKLIQFQSEEEWYLFLNYIQLVHATITRCYNFSTKNFIGKLITHKKTINDYDYILNLTDKFLVTFKNYENITLKATEDIATYMYLTDTKEVIIKIVLFTYKSVDKDNYTKLVNLLNRIHLTLVTKELDN